MLIAGLTAIATWENIFPDRRDAMVLGPLPVRAHTILAAKVAASGSLLTIGIIAINCGMGIALPLLAGGLLHFPRIFVAYWFTVAGSGIFVFGAVLTLQGLLAAICREDGFCDSRQSFNSPDLLDFYRCGSFNAALAPPSGFASAQQHGVLMRWPVFWFFGVFCQTSGIFPIAVHTLALQDG